MARFHTNEHRFAYSGAEPKGRGTWGFHECDSAGRVSDERRARPYWAPFGTLTEAKKAVIAARPGWDHISVAP